MSKPTDLAEYRGDIMLAASHMAQSDEDKKRIFQLALRATEDVRKKCTPDSIARALVNGLALNLDPSPALGFLYFVPYGNVCNLQVGYRGWIQLADRAGIFLRGGVVRANDFFEVIMGSEQDVKHKYDPILSDEERGEVVASYAVWSHKSNPSQKHVTVLNRDDLRKIRMKASARSDAWNTWYDRMAMKSAINRAAKTMPLATDEIRMAQTFDTETEQAMSAENDYPAARPVVQVSLEPEPQDTPEFPPEAETEIMATEHTINAIVNHSYKWEMVPDDMKVKIRKKHGANFSFKRDIIEDMTEIDAQKLLDWMDTQVLGSPPEDK